MMKELKLSGIRLSKKDASEDKLTSIRQERSGSLRNASTQERRQKQFSERKVSYINSDASYRESANEAIRKK